MNFKKSQSGRSMVEMLGVLAIIGVLSVGGIAGYSLSMRRHRANQIADTAAKYAVVLYNRCQQHLMEGTTSKDSPVTCLANILPSFEDAGIGPMPSGARLFESYNVDLDTVDGVDKVVMSLEFDDIKLCQSVASVTGSNCDSSSIAIISFKQN